MSKSKKKSREVIETDSRRGQTVPSIPFNWYFLLFANARNVTGVFGALISALTCFPSSSVARVA